MSVSWECKVDKNDVIYFIDNCCTEVVIDENGVFDEEKSIEYKVGDRVKFLDWYTEIIGGIEYIEIKFKDEEGRIFSAVESFFVTEDVWEGLKAYIKNYFEG